jgi:hypothetical protein
LRASARRTRPPCASRLPPFKLGPRAARRRWWPIRRMRPTPPSPRARGGAGTRAEPGVPREAGARARRRTAWRRMLAGSSRTQGSCDCRRPGHAPRGRARRVRARLLRSPRVVVRLSARRVDGSPACRPRSYWRAHTCWHPVPVCPLPPPLARVLVRRVMYPLRPNEAAHALVRAIHQVIHGLRNSRGGAVDDSTYVSLATSR